MSEKTNQELIEEWLKHNEVEVVPEIKPKNSDTTVRPLKINISNIISIGEAIDTFGEKQKRTVKRKKKQPDVSNINKDLIPESLHSILNKFNNNETKEQVDEANRD